MPALRTATAAVLLVLAAVTACTPADAGDSRLQESSEEAPKAKHRKEDVPPEPVVDCEPAGETADAPPDPVTGWDNAEAIGEC